MCISVMINRPIENFLNQLKAQFRPQQQQQPKKKENKAFEIEFLYIFYKKLNLTISGLGSINRPFFKKNFSKLKNFSFCAPTINSSINDNHSSRLMEKFRHTHDRKYEIQKEQLD